VLLYVGLGVLGSLLCCEVFILVGYCVMIFIRYYMIFIRCYMIFIRYYMIFIRYYMIFVGYCGL